MSDHRRCGNVAFLYGPLCVMLALQALLALDAESVHAQTPCVNVNDCSGESYTVRKNFFLADPTSAPTNAAGPTTGGSCTSAETYRTYVAWCNESGCTAVSPASELDFQPTSGTSNKITVTRPTILDGATSWSAYYSKSSESHTKIRHCSSLLALVGTVSRSSATEDCKCVSAGGQQQSANGTGVVQTIKLDPEGTIKFSGKDGTVQSKLIAGKAVLEFSKDLAPRFSPDAGVNFRTVDWNSATVYYVEPNIGKLQTFGRTVFISLQDAVAAITDSSYTKPYVIKLRNNGGSELAGGSVNKPYIWIQGDGATRIGEIRIMADGVRASGLITQAIHVGVDDAALPPTDIDNIWISGNIVTNGPAQSQQCKIVVHVGGGSRSHSVFVSGNRLGGSNDPASDTENRCYLQNLAGSSGTSTVVVFADNYVESHQCIHGYNALILIGSSVNATTISSRNTFVCNVASGIQQPGESFSCIMAGFGFGKLHSIDDTCILSRQDTGPYPHDYSLMQVDQNYPDTIPRLAEFINPTFMINLPAAHFAGDKIGYFLMDTPYLTFTISNPRYFELALGSGWTADDRSFVMVDGWRPYPPNGANTFLRWNDVMAGPDSDIVFRNGATAASITAAPSSRIMLENFGSAISIDGTALGASCEVGEFRYDTGGATKELCICDSANTWKCSPLGPKQD